MATQHRCCHRSVLGAEVPQPRCSIEPSSGEPPTVRAECCRKGVMSSQHPRRIAWLRCREIPKLCLAILPLRNQLMAVWAEHPDARGVRSFEQDATRGLWFLRTEVPEFHHRVQIAFRWGLLMDVGSCHQPARIWAESLVEHDSVSRFIYGQEAGLGRRRLCVDIQELR